MAWAEYLAGMNDRSTSRTPASGAVLMANTMLAVSIFLPWIEVDSGQSVLGVDMLFGQHPNAANGYVAVASLAVLVFIVSVSCGTPRRPQDALKFVAITLFGIAAAAGAGTWVLDEILDPGADVVGGVGLATFAFVVLGVAWAREPSRRSRPRRRGASGAVV